MHRIPLVAAHSISDLLDFNYWTSTNIGQIGTRFSQKTCLGMYEELRNKDGDFLVLLVQKILDLERQKILKLKSSINLELGEGG